MGRCLRTTVPQAREQFLPQWSYLPRFQRDEQQHKGKQEKNFDRRHRTLALPIIPDGSDVWISAERGERRGTVVTEAQTPRSYIVETPTGSVRRNRSHLKVVPQSASEEHSNLEVQGNIDTDRVQRPITRSQTGTAIVPPVRLDL